MATKPLEKALRIGAMALVACLLALATTAQAGSALAWAFEGEGGAGEGGEGGSSGGTVMPLQEGAAYAESVGADEEAGIAAELPSSYDLRDVDGACYVTPVRSQGRYGTCWAHSFLSSAESGYLKKTGASASSIDLSPVQLACFCFKLPATVRAGLEGDENRITGGSGGFLTGGTAYTAGFMAMAGIGLAKDSDVPYSLVQSATDFSASTGITDDMAYGMNSYRVKDVTYVSYSDRNAIKKLLMEKGAAVAGYYHDDSSVYAAASGTYAYYQTSVTAWQNHDITIVGWDDDFSAFDPDNMPSGNGAWLVKNSWGTRWGQDGYFWISYEDPSIGLVDFAFVDIEAADSAEQIYQYDGNSSQSSIYMSNTFTAANVFTARTDLELDSVAYQSNTTGASYTIRIYTDLADGGDPATGTLATQATTTGTSAYAGYHSIDLASSVAVEEGTSYAVAITLEKQGDYVFLGTDHSSTYDGATISYIGSAETGQSFYWNNVSWVNLESGGTPMNLRIKAYGTETTRSLEGAVVESIADRPYTGCAIEPEPAVTLNGKTLEKDVDYTLSYTDNVEPGTATVTATGIGSYTGAVSATFQITIARDYTRGDANKNGRVSVADAQIVLDMANGAWTSSASAAPYDLLLAQIANWNLPNLRWAADANLDEAVDAQDARAIQSYVHAGAWPSSAEA